MDQNVMRKNHHQCEVKAVKLFMVMTEGGFEKKIEVLCKKTDQH